MAAGVGSRYGGTKQLAQVGPAGEAFLDFAIADAVAAGAHKVVIVVRTAIADDIRQHVDSRHHTLASAGIEVAYVRQDELGPPRTRPWGTAHAALAAAPEVSGPFVICNADDYYGTSAFASLAESLPDMGDTEAVLCCYQLGFTLPIRGAVSRGVCDVDDNHLVSIVEHHGVSRHVNGSIASENPPANLQESTLVSMNLWAFPPIMFDWIASGFQRFLLEHADDPDAEYILPEVVSSKMADGALTVRTVITDERWTGITNPDDLADARTILAQRANTADGNVD